MREASKRPKRGAAKVRHLGRHKAKIAHYYDKIYPLHKLTRILKHNGPQAARSWAMKHGQVGLLGSLAAKMGIDI